MPRGFNPLPSEVADVFHNANALLEEIGELIDYQNIPFLDAIEHVAAEHSIDPEQITGLIKTNRQFRAKITQAASDLRLLKPEKPKRKR
jgi:hypothetical protein